MKEERIFYKNGNEKIAAVLHTPNKPSKKAVVLLHGFRGDKDGECGTDVYPLLARSLCKEGFNVLRFDCRGTGESDGKFEDMTFMSEASDLKKSIDFMRSKENDKIAVVGASFGGGVTLLAYDKSIDCVILWYPLIYVERSNSLKFLHSVKKELEEKGKVLTTSSSGKKFWVGKYLYEEWQKVDPSKKLKTIKCPVLIVTGTNDHALPPDVAEKAMSQIKSPKKLIVVKGAYHCWKDFDGKPIETYKLKAIRDTTDWIKKNL